MFSHIFPIGPLTIPDSLFNGLPGLRELVVETVLSQYNLSDLAKNLTYLHLTLFSDYGSERLRPSLPETLRVVCAARNLETLSLERKHRGDLRRNTPRVPPPNPLSTPYDLPRLRSLHIKGGVDWLCFLGYFTFSSAITVDVEKPPESIPSNLRHPNNSGLTQLFSSPPISDELTLHTALSLETNTPCVRVTFGGNLPPIDRAAAMRNLYTSLQPLSHLRTLHLHYRDWNPHYKDHIRVSFGSLPELDTLSISGGDAAIDMIPVLGDMAISFGQPSVDSAVNMAFPSLRTLWLRYWVEKWRTRSERQPFHGEPEWVAHRLEPSSFAYRTPIAQPG
ncbi:hypothetical protein PQX77_019223 [Marasmius sp. AFHP31]|nr:hypothetical protein PQX77_019223 [Marasmius sp. AFHP31]